MTNAPITNPVAPVVTRRDLEARIVAKAWRHPAYLQRLLTDPKSVLQSEVSAADPGVTLPAGLQVSVHQETPNTYHLVLPRNPKEIALSEVLPDDLEAVAPQTIAVVVIAVVAVNTVGAANNIGAVNAVTAGNVATTGNVAANFNSVG
ncbi:MAG: NHLP leader peptide family RiPP precursor [Xanthobacteraceae bacterium]